MNEAQIPTQRSRRKVARILVAVLAAIVGGIVALAVLPHRGEILPEKAPSVMTVAVRAALSTNLPEVVTLSGRVEAETDVRLATETSGRVVWLGVTKGDPVVPGQELMRLDSRSQTAALSRAEITLRQAEDDLKRWQALKSAGSMSSQEFEAGQNRRDLARIALDEARTDLDRCTVRSPVSGRLEERGIEVGETAVPGVPALRVVKVDRVKIVVDVPERDVRALRTGTRMCFDVTALNGETFTGEVTYVATVADPRSNTFRIELLAANTGERLKPGMLVRVVMARRMIEGAIVVPLSALVPEKGQYIAYLVEDDRAVRRVVRLEAVVDVLAVVREGLRPGDRVIVEGQRLVTDGAAVTVAP